MSHEKQPHPNPEPEFIPPKLTEDIYSKIKEFARNPPTKAPVEQQLRDNFGEFNLDWRRITVFERAIDANNRFLARYKPGETVKWLTPPEACQYCQQLNGRIFTVVSPSKPNKNPEAEIWVGKADENRGKRLNPLIRLPSGRLRKRKPDEKKAPAIPLHEHCRCLWLPNIPQKQGSLAGQRPGSVDAQNRISPDVGNSPAFLNLTPDTQGP